MQEKEKGPAEWVQDLVKLPELTEETILQNLRLGYVNDEIYTYVGPVLVSINPFKRIEKLYGEHVMEAYKNAIRREDNRPHTYNVAQAAYDGLTKAIRNQSIIVSGESGAGKTEVNKQVLAFITNLTKQGTHGERTKVEDMIMAGQPVLEAFGNAKTMRNNNSSRFGKFTKLTFKDGKILGSVVETYLLEKSRVVFCNEGERNYHIFYMLLKGASDEWRTEFNLKPAGEYRYLNQSSAVDVKGFDDLKEFNDVMASFKLYDFTDEEIKSVFRTVAAVLHIGNIEFQFNETMKRMEPANKDLIVLVSKMLGLAHPQILEIILTTRKISGGGRSSTYSVSNTAEEVVDFRDALAKHVYQRLFDWIVKRLNKSSSTSGGIDADAAKTKSAELFIGVLDIFGFEVFEHNSFEQLCINFTNEKLHQQFCEFMFKVEQQEYTAEGVGWDSVAFTDNAECVALIEASGSGILATLDEECKMPKGTDESFLEKLVNKHQQHKYFEQQKFGRNVKADQKPGFTVNHFAYPVYYDADGMLLKNKDRLYPDIEGALERSKDPFIGALFPDAEGAAAPAKGGRGGGAARGGKGGGGATKARTLGFYFKGQLQSLYNTIFETQPHYVRCIKPNPNQAANEFDDDYISRQLRYVGIMETIRIRKAGYGLREKFEDFVRRFGVIVPDDISKLPPGKKCEKILEVAAVDPTLFQVGKSKVFLRDDAVPPLDALVRERLKTIILVVQAAVRGMVDRCNYVAEQKAHHERLEAERKAAQEALAAVVGPAVRGMLSRKEYVPALEKFHAEKEEERKRREEEERKRREEEERKRREEEEARKKAEEEAEAKRLAELAALDEAKRKEAEEAYAKEQEEKAAAAAAEAAAFAEAHQADYVFDPSTAPYTVPAPPPPNPKWLLDTDLSSELKVKEEEDKEKEVIKKKAEEEAAIIKEAEDARIKALAEEADKRLAMALFDYDGKFLKDGSALILAKWQVVEIIDELSNDWWLGASAGKDGLFPAAYVEELPAPLKKVVAEYDFDSSVDGHLNFTEGTQITVVEERDGWMWGHVNGSYGRFPANYTFDPSGSAATPEAAIAQAEKEKQAAAPAAAAAAGGAPAAAAAAPAAADKASSSVQVLPDDAPAPPQFLTTFCKRKLLRASTPFDHKMSVIRGKDLNASPMEDISAYLFDDIMFFGRYQPRNLVFDCVFYVQLSESRLIDLSLPPGKKMKGFQIEVKSRSLYSFLFDDEATKNAWREDCKLVIRNFQVRHMMKMEQEAAEKAAAEGKKPAEGGGVGRRIMRTLTRKTLTPDKDKAKKAAAKDGGASSVMNLMNPSQLFLRDLPEVWGSTFSQLGLTPEVSEVNSTCHLDTFTKLHVACIQNRERCTLARAELSKSLGKTMTTMKRKSMRPGA
jgi:hypothetical protein